MLKITLHKLYVLHMIAKSKYPSKYTKSRPRSLEKSVSKNTWERKLEILIYSEISAVINHSMHSLCYSHIINYGNQCEIFFKIISSRLNNITDEHIKSYVWILKCDHSLGKHREKYKGIKCFKKHIFLKNISRVVWSSLENPTSFE